MKGSLRATPFAFARSLCLGVVLAVLLSGPVGAVSSDEDRLFRLAAHDKDNGAVRQLLAEGVSPNAQGNFDGRTAVHSAAEGGAAKNLAALLQSGGKPNVQDREGNTPLHLASMGSFSLGFTDHVAAVRILLKHGADLHRTNNAGETALHIATHTGVGSAHSDIIKALLAAGAKPQQVDGDGLTALQRFVRHGSDDGEIVALLLKAGANPDDKDSRGDAPLHAAIKTGGSNGKANVVEALLDGGANPCVRDDRGYTPYHLADSRGMTRSRQALDSAHGFDASHAGASGCQLGSEDGSEMTDKSEGSEDSAEMAYEGSDGSDDSSKMAYEEVAYLGEILQESSGNENSSEMGYEREIRALEEVEEARLAEEARIAEEARRAEEIRRVEKARRQSSGAVHSSNCQENPTPTCSRVLAMIEARSAPIMARLDAGGLSISRTAELQAQMLKVFLDYAPACFATETRPQCRAANQRDLEQVRRSYESALETARQARGR